MALRQPRIIRTMPRLDLLRAQTDLIIALNRRQVQRVAQTLMERRVLSGDEILVLFRPRNGLGVCAPYTEWWGNARAGRGVGHNPRLHEDSFPIHYDGGQEFSRSAKEQ